MSKPMYRLVDGKGRVLIPKSMREAAKLEYGDIVCLGMAGGNSQKRIVCRQKRRHLSRTGWWFFPQRYYQSITQGSFFSVRISRKQKIPDTPLPIWFPYLLGRHGTAGTGMWLVCCGQNCWGKRNDSSSPRSVHLGRWIYMDIPLNILDTVFCRMDAMRQGYGW